MRRKLVEGGKNTRKSTVLRSFCWFFYINKETLLCHLGKNQARFFLTQCAQIHFVCWLWVPLNGTRHHLKFQTHWITKKTRPDTRLPQSHAGGQELYLRSLDHLGRSSEAKDRKKKNIKKVKKSKAWQTDQPTDQPTDRQTNRVTKHATKNVSIKHTN